MTKYYVSLSEDGDFVTDTVVEGWEAVEGKVSEYMGAALFIMKVRKIEEEFTAWAAVTMYHSPKRVVRITEHSNVATREKKDTFNQTDSFSEYED